MKREITKLWKNGRMPLAVAAVALALGNTPVHAQEQGGTETETPDESVTWVDVTNQYLKNADFSTGTNEGWKDGTNTNPTVHKNWKDAELYQTNTSIAQKVTGLQPGTYKLTVQGFHRPAENDNGAAYGENRETLYAYLFAGENKKLMKSLYSEPKDNTGINNTKNGWPEGMEGACKFFETYPNSYHNELVFTVSETQDILMGVVSETRASRSWTLCDNFKLYIAINNLHEALQAQINGLKQLVPELDGAGLTQAATTLQTTIDTYEGYGEQTDDETINAAIAAIPDIIATTNTLVTAANSLHTAINDCDAFNTTNAITNLKNQLSTLIGNAEQSFSGCALTDEAAAGLDAATTELNNLTTAGKELMTAINNCENYANGEGKVITNLPATLASSVEAAKAVELGNDAIAALNAKATGLNDLLAAGQNLMATINNCETFLKNFTEEVNATHAEELTQSIATAKAVVLTENATTTMNNEAAALNTMFINADGWISLVFVLNKAKALADQIGGLNDEKAYKKVVADLDYADLTYDAMAADIAALNVVCRNAMTADFLSKASTENPIDLTSFIENPNVYQAGGDNIEPDRNGNDSPKRVDGWDIIQLSEYNSPSVTSDLLGDSELYSGSWSANENNNIGRGHYCTSVGNTEGINLPDGRYLLTAATFMTRSGETQKVGLYASLDNNKIEAYSNFNGDRTLYDAAAGHNDGKTTEVEIDVRGGKLYFGIKGNGEIVGGQGQHWIADNFRLYYIGETPNSPLEISVSDAGYATYYAPNAFTMPEGLTGGIAKSVDTDASKLTIDWCYQPGSTVPALTGIILQGNEGEYTGEPSVAAATAPTGNLLRGTLEETTINEAGHLYYKLAKDSENGIGFYWDAENGTSINNGANKAYLAIEQTPEASETNFLLWDWDATGIAGTVAEEAAPVDVYTLSGIRVRTQVAPAEALDGLQKGIYIVNGKKVIK